MSPSSTGSARTVTLTRIIAIAALALAVVVIAFLLLRGDGGSTYKLLFINGGQLVKDDDVQIGGRRVGSIREIDLTNDNQAEVTIELQEEFAPLHQGTTGTIRATSLSGIANRYIALNPGPNSKPELPENATLTAEETTTPVDLDQLFNTLDKPTRKSLQNFVQGSATQYQGRGRENNEAAKYFAPALSTTDTLVRELLSDRATLFNFLVNSSRVVSTIAERRDDLAGLVGNANQTAAAIAAETSAFEQALSLLPGTLRKGSTTFVNLRATLTDLDTLVAASKPATRRLAPFLRELRPLVAAARPTIADLRQLISQAGPNNDLLDATRKLPRLQRIASPTFSSTIRALDKAEPVVKFIRPYTPDFVGWLRDFGAGSANYDANGHFARIQPIFNAFNLVNGTLVPIPPGNRLDGFQTGVVRRCPGTASQVPTDGSAPFRDTDGSLDCDPSLVLPGP